MTDKFNGRHGRTADEIKKGLECCNTFNACRKCPYEKAVDTEHGWGCVVIRNADALAYIQQLEARIDTLTAKAVLFDEAVAAGEKYKRERDAAVEDMTEIMRHSGQCDFCKYLDDDGDCTGAPRLGELCWQWRGAQEVE